MISDSEIVDFNTAIADAGFDVDDFNLVAVDDGPPTIEQYVVTGTVTVRRISSGDITEYRVEPGLSWLTAFTDDLTAGKFGQP